MRLSDKLSRLCNLVRPGHAQAVLDESLRDTALDVINYVALLLGYMETKREAEMEAKRQRPVIAGPEPAQRVVDPPEHGALQCPSCLGREFEEVKSGPGPCGYAGPRTVCKKCGFMLFTSGVVAR